MKKIFLYPVCKIYYGECEYCGDNYIGETVWNTVTRWSKHNNPDRKSEPAENIKRDIDHVLNWIALCAAPSKKHLRKNFQVIFIALYKPSLNDQKSFDRLILFRNGVTWFLFWDDVFMSQRINIIKYDMHILFIEKNLIDIFM